MVETRLFVAIEPSVNIVEKLVLVQEDLSPILHSRGAKARWFDAPNIHLTLKFIGEVDAAILSVVAVCLKEISERHEPFRINTEGIFAFPTGDRPQIIYAGLSVGREHLESLRETIEVRMEEIGIQRDARLFLPHLTIGRVRTSNERVDLTDVIGALKNINFGYSMIRDVTLFRSTLVASGANYEVVKRAPLGRTRGV